MQLPGSKAMADLGELEIKDGAVYLPFKSVFICHARGERAKAEKLLVQLGEDGLLAWRGTRDLTPGAKWRAKMAQGVNEADCVWVLFSDRGISDKGTAQPEIALAFELIERGTDKAQITVPVLLENCRVPDSLEGKQWTR